MNSARTHAVPLIRRTDIYERTDTIHKEKSLSLDNFKPTQILNENNITVTSTMFFYKVFLHTKTHTCTHIALFIRDFIHIFHFRCIIRSGNNVDDIRK